MTIVKLHFDVWKKLLRLCLFGVVVLGVLSSHCVYAENIPLQQDNKVFPGIKKSITDDGFKLTATSASLPKIFTIIGKFNAQSQMLYRVETNIRGINLPANASASLVIRWLNEDGSDAAIEEKALGYKDSTLRAVTPAGWQGESIKLSMVGPAAKTAIKYGQLELLLTPSQAGTTIEVAAVKINSGADSAAVISENDNTAILFDRGDDSYRFCNNLVENASFENGTENIVSGWHYEGTGTPHIGIGGYAGKRCLLLKKDNADGGWISTPAAISANMPVWLGYWTKFSEYARPAGHVNPVQLEFLRRESSGSWVKVPYVFNWEFDSGKYFSLFGQWFQVTIGPVIPPPGATHVRAFTRYQDSRKNWTAELAIANWGDIAIDNVTLWQSNRPPPSIVEKNAQKNAINNANDTLPPFVPVGVRRDNSIAVDPVRHADANLFFVDDGPNPMVKIRLANLLPVKRNLTIDGRVIDWNGKTVATIKKAAILMPYASVEEALPVSAPLQYGAYLIELQTFEGKLLCNNSSVRFAWLKRPHIDEAERHHEQYPFDMNPARIYADFEGIDNHDEIDFQLRLMRLMGVRGVRMQSRYHKLDFANPQAAASGARSKVETWRRNVLPYLQKYKIEGWVSFMEQGSNNTRAPLSEMDFRAWHAYNLEQVKLFGNDIKFFLFGNEGLGGHTPEDPDQSCLRKSAFNGTTRDWMKAYQAAYAAAKKANPKCVFGLSHASDPNAMVAQRFYKILGNNGKFDCWGFNAYGNTAEMGKNIYNVLQSHGSVEAFGVIPEVGLDVPTFGSTRIAGERRQAITLVQTYLDVLAKAPWVKRIAWFHMQSGRGVEGHQLFDADWTPRPSAVAYMVLAEHLGAGKVEKKFELPGGGEFIVWRKTNGKVIGIGWSATEQVISLETGTEQVIADDIFGNRQTLKATNGLVNVLLTDVPTYLIGAEKIEQSRLFEINARNVTTSADGSSIVALDIRNNGPKAETLTIQAQAHPLIRLSPATMVVETRPGETTRREFKVSFLQQNDRMRSPISFQATTKEGMVFRIKMADTFIRCVRAPQDFRLDGTWEKWKHAQVLHADQRTQTEQPMGVAWKGPDDVSARIMTMWDDKYFYLGVQVHDNIFSANCPVERMFLNDAVEIGFDLEHRLSGNSKLWQFVMGKSKSGDALFQHQPGPGKLIPADSRILHIQPAGTGGDVNYQVGIPWTELGTFIPTVGRQIGFGVIIDDSDGNTGDRKFISWFGSGISSKRPQELGDLIFVK